MRLLLANPAGLWALLAVPAILVIHFLQEKSRRVRVSTLFLLERVKPESVGGMRFERLRNSVPLWLQLLAALLLAWVLVEPRWIRQDSRQTVAVVLDSSVSMSAFKDETRELLAGKLRDWSRTAAHTEWHLLESDARKPTLYAGAEMAGVLRGFDEWKPSQGTHRPDDALLIARGLVKSNGIVIFVTDREIEVSSDVAVLSAGDPLQNTGFAGAEVKLADSSAGTNGGMKWKALVRNYGDKPARQEWWVDYPDLSPGTGGAPQKRTLDIPPGQTIHLEGEFPPDVERAVLLLGGDKFVWDDRLPIQKPRPRVVEAEVRLGGQAGDLWRKMLGATEQVVLRGSAAAAAAGSDTGSALRQPHLVVSELGTPLETAGIQFPVETGDGMQLDGSWTIAEDHPLVRDMNWMGLLTPRPAELAVTETDEPLLWKGERVLAMVRRGRTAENRPTRRLLLAWDITQSNAPRHPAMLVMIHRFLEEVRLGMTEPWSGNFESGQDIPVAADEAPEAPPLQLHHDGKVVRYDGHLPAMVGFFQVRQGERALVSGSAQFADTREADFAGAKKVDTVEQRRWEAAMKQTEADPLTALWVLLILACLLAAWAWRQGGAKPRASAATPAVPATA
ncbi:aerotolerance regulator-like protein [Roseimicrobium gellanilyticum]|uniref:Aerotolerance regulator-like protein n=1 Tax=Roseimicrobium gellanilyticum TaxID=748857 RepID=A0A366H851_9BACT|nr:BatA domain-containing protein [Roseimicrobium gellanilyticum]RBP37682.1 aerotolerance regulator-like protein [Roseimicrobium gellanilyticum]